VSRFIGRIEATAIHFEPMGFERLIPAASSLIVVRRISGTIKLIIKNSENLFASG
jgi:hypothetical protein